MSNNNESFPSCHSSCALCAEILLGSWITDTFVFYVKNLRSWSNLFKTFSRFLQQILLFYCYFLQLPLWIDHYHYQSESIIGNFFESNPYNIPWHLNKWISQYFLLFLSRVDPRTRSCLRCFTAWFFKVLLGTSKSWAAPRINLPFSFTLLTTQSPVFRPHC